MRFFSHHQQVAELIISSVPIAMVDELARLQIPPDGLLNHQAVVHDVALRVGKGVIRNSQSEVPTSAPVANQGAPQRGSALGRNAAWDRAELLIAIPGGSDVQAAGAARIRWSDPPSTDAIASPGAEARRVLASVLRVKRGGALFAGFGDGESLHSPIVRINEQYCEIAAKRLQQGVLL